MSREPASAGDRGMLNALMSGCPVDRIQGGNHEGFSRMKYQDFINVIIAADDLHYDPAQRQFFSVSDAEVQAIQEKCRNAGIKGLAEIYTIIHWRGSIRVGEILYRSFMSGRLRIIGVKDKEPVFAPLKDGP